MNLKLKTQLPINVDNPNENHLKIFLFHFFGKKSTGIKLLSSKSKPKYIIVYEYITSIYRLTSFGRFSLRSKIY